MAKAHCKNHKRFVPTCDACKSAALKETVGFPGGRTEPEPEETNDTGVVGGGGSSETVNDIPEYEPDDEEADHEPPPGQVSDAEAAGWPDEPKGEEQPPDDPDAPLVEGAPGPDAVPIGGMFPPKDIDETEEAMAAEGEFDTEGQLQEVSLVPGEGEPEQGPTEMTPLEIAMFMFPKRLIPEGATEVCDEERPNEPYMASYEELVRRAVKGYLELGLSPEDANIVVAAEIIKSDQLNFLPVDEEEADEEAFDAGLEAAPEITGCIEDYNQGFNEGMSAIHLLLLGHYAGDEDSVAYEMMRWLERQMLEMKK